jgi:hypothetical protein
VTSLRRNLRGPLAAFLLLVAMGLLPAAAQASTHILSFSTATSTTQAGGHPDFSVEFALTSHSTNLDPCDCTDAKNATVHLPTGLIGNPHATPQCDIAAFASNLCPPDSQVGVAEAVVSGAPNQGSGRGSRFLSPLFNLVPPPSEPGLLGWKTAVFDTPTFEVISARTGGDYGLDVETTSIEHFAPLTYFFQVTWGVPASPIHEGLRFGLGESPLGLTTVFGGPVESPLCDANANPSTTDPATVYQICSPNKGAATPHEFVGAIGEAENPPTPFVHLHAPGYPVPSESPEVPFTQNPTTCGLTSLSTSLDVLSYDGGLTNANSTWPATTDCAQLAFNPSLFAKPTSEETDSPSGINVDLKAPLFESPSVPSPSEIRSTVVTLPPGFTINPNAADGKTSCSDAQAKFGTTEEAQCPEFAKLGTLEVHSPVLPGVLPGAVYIGKPLPGERYRLVITFDGFGVHVKLPGTVHPDPRTGQVVTEFKNLPQFPFEDFDLHFFGAEHGVLATPTQCGTYPVSTEFEPWDGALANQTSTQFFRLEHGPNGSPCPNGPRPFAPGLKAASASNTAAAHTAFWLDLTRNDGEQNLSALDVTTPPGFSATLKGVPYCPEAAIAAAAAPGYSGLAESEHASCPAQSQVGEAIAGAGAGTHPFYAPGKVYLAGPYKGAPLSLVVITPAVSGPYDLGDVVVRAALHVNPETAQVTAVTENLPQILEGVPLRIRSILVNLNRPGFALNPTNCEPLSVGAQVSGSEGATANLSSPFQVANCAALPFAPKLSISLKGATKRAGHPALRAVLTMPPGNANIARAQVTLPHSEFLDQGHIGTVCTRVQFAAGSTPGEKCPAASIYGFARAETPLLGKPLEGPVYLRSSSHKLPDLVAALNGQIQIALDGKIDTGKGGGIRNSFEVVPDAPVSRFTLSMQGGSKGLLENSEDLCSRQAKTQATVEFSAQNGKVYDTAPALANGCGGKGRKAHKRKRAKLSRAESASRGGGR